jgi:hypothetical protein
LGSVNDPAQTLTFVGDVLIGSAGELFVAQPQDQRIMVFSESGGILRVMGGRGFGPGEFQTISSLGFLGDTLYVTDGNQKRISYFDQNGGLHRTVMTLSSPMLGTKVPAVMLPTVPQVLLPNGSALVLPSIPVAWHETGEARVPYLRLNQSTGEIDDTIAWRHYPPSLFYLMHNGTRMGAWRPFPTEPLFAFAPDGSGIVTVSRDPAESVSRDATYQVVKISTDGDTVFARTVAYRPRPMNSELVGRAAEASRAFMSRRHDPPSAAAIRDHLQRENWVPRTMVAVTDVIVDQNGWIWLRREYAMRDHPVRWDVLGPGGELLSSVILPSHQTVKAVRGDILVAVELDDLDVPYLVRYRIRRQ